MVVTYYVIKYPYKLVWNILNFFKKRKEIVFYCANELDLEIFKNVEKHLLPVSIVVKNKKMQDKLSKMGVRSRCMPVFPKGVIMCRQACYLFPEKKIVRIGINHGAYHFKPFANVKGHNMFDQFFFSSEQEVQEAKEIGIKSGVGVGFPKLDDAFNGSYSDTKLHSLSDTLHLNKNKKTLLFSATWDGSHMSAIHRWYDKLDQFTKEYNVLVTVHIWTSEKYKKTIKQTPGVHFVETQDVIPYIMLSDLCVGDTSSILSEMCALHKPIVSFYTPVVKSTVLEVREIIEEISFQVKTLKELKEIIPFALENSELKQKNRDKANIRMFQCLDGGAGKRVANKMLELLPELRKEE